MSKLGKNLPINTGFGLPTWVTLLGMQLSIIDAANALGVSTNTVRRRLTSGLLTGNKVGNQWLINVPEPDIEPITNKEWAEAEALASGIAGDVSRELIDQLRADLANASDRITFLEGHISQIWATQLNPAPKPKKQSWWSRMWHGVLEV